MSPGDLNALLLLQAAQLELLAATLELPQQVALRLAELRMALAPVVNGQPVPRVETETAARRLFLLAAELAEHERRQRPAFVTRYARHG